MQDKPTPKTLDMNQNTQTSEKSTQESWKILTASVLDSHVRLFQSLENEEDLPTVCLRDWGHWSEDDCEAHGYVGFGIWSGNPEDIRYHLRKQQGNELYKRVYKAAAKRETKAKMKKRVRFDLTQNVIVPYDKN